MHDSYRAEILAWNYYKMMSGRGQFDDRNMTAEHGTQAGVISGATLPRACSASVNAAQSKVAREASRTSAG
jgi:hypothetical protein